MKGLSQFALIGQSYTPTDLIKDIDDKQRIPVTILLFFCILTKQITHTLHLIETILPRKQ